jgi:hypothetical protein
LSRVVVEEEDRRKNIMVFGLTEETNEDIGSNVGKVFLELGLKPTMEVSRVGKIKKK